MRTALSQLEVFYEGEMGTLVAQTLAAKLFQAWGDAAQQRVVGFGYCAPYLGTFAAAERLVALVPQGTGVRAHAALPSCLTEDHYWPLPDASADRIVIVHGLEEVAGPRRLLREAWRVLTSDGLLIIVAPNRRGPWSVFETSPFAAGRPYSRRQLDSLLSECMFQPTAHATALHFPPFPQKAILRIARTWEELGERIEGWNLPHVLPNFAGVNLVEARKAMAAPISGSKATVFSPGVLMPGGLTPARRDG